MCTLAFNFCPWVSHVQLDKFNVATRGDAGAAFATLLQAQQQFILYLQIPCIVVFTRLQNSTGCRHRIAAALHFNAVKVGTVWFVVVVVDHTPQHVTWFEVGELVGACANRPEIGGCIARCCAFERLKNMLGDDHSSCADQRIGPKRRSFLKLNSYRMAVHFGDLHIAVRAFGVSGGCWVGRIGRCKHHIICCERFAVVPEHVSFELPGDGLAVARYTAIG